MCIRKYLFFIFLILGIFNTYGQVTIGSDEEPSIGTLLDLKQSSAKGANTVKGLDLPRVRLLSDSITNTSRGLSSTIENAPNEDWNAEKHVGLSVYHIDPCTIDGIGTYTWNGNSWNKLGLSNKLLSSVKILSYDPQKIEPNKQVMFKADPDYEGNSYTWTVNSGGANISTGSGSVFSFIPTVAGDYKVGLTVTSDRCPSHVVSTATNITAENPCSPVTSTSISASSSNVSVGDPIIFRSVANTEATTPVQYLWSVSRNSMEIANGSGSTFLYTPKEAGIYTIKVTASNSCTTSIVSNSTVITAAAPCSPVTTATITPTSSSITVGRAVTFTGGTNVGATTPSYVWTIIQGSTVVGNGTGSTFTYTPTVAGSYTVRVTASNSCTSTAVSSTTSLTAVAACNPITTATITPTSSSVTVGKSVTFTGGTNVGATTPSYVWVIMKGSTLVTNGTGSTFTYTPASDGVYTVRVTASNSCTSTAVSSTTSLTAIAACSPVTTATITPTSSSVTVGKAVTFTGGTNVGATTPITYTWTIIQGSTVVGNGTGSTFTYTPTVAGSYTVRLTASNSCTSTAVSSTTSLTAIAACSPVTTVTISPASNNNGAVGTAINFTSSVNSTATAPVTYTWRVMSGGTQVATGSGSTFLYTPSAEGTYVVSVSASNSCTSTPVTNSSTITVLPECWAYVNDQPRGFQCRNVGAQGVDWKVPDTRLVGNYYQWGTNAYFGRLTNTDTGTTGTLLLNGPWSDLSGQNTSANGLTWNDNICPSGYRIPTAAEMESVFADSRNTQTRVGSWQTGLSKASGMNVGDHLYFPAGGRISQSAFSEFGSGLYYWSSTGYSPGRARNYGYGGTDSSMAVSTWAASSWGNNVRCIKN